MKKIILLLLVLQLSAFSVLAGKNTNTWDYPFLAFDKFETKGSQDFYQFQSNLKEDKDVLKEFENNKKTGLISYLLFENNKIVIDESDIPRQVKGIELLMVCYPHTQWVKV